MADNRQKPIAQPRQRRVTRQIIWLEPGAPVRSLVARQRSEEFLELELFRMGEAVAEDAKDFDILGPFASSERAVMEVMDFEFCGVLAAAFAFAVVVAPGQLLPREPPPLH